MSDRGDLNEISVSIGRLQAQMEGLTNTVDKVVQSVDTLKTAMSEARGGWKTLVAIGAILTFISGALGAVASYFLPFLGR